MDSGTTAQSIITNTGPDAFEPFISKTTDQSTSIVTLGSCGDLLYTITASDAVLPPLLSITGLTYDSGASTSAVLKYYGASGSAITF